jgi:hypothetical protein
MVPRSETVWSVIPSLFLDDVDGRRVAGRFGSGSTKSFHEVRTDPSLTRREIFIHKLSEHNRCLSATMTEKRVLRAAGPT